MGRKVGISTELVHDTATRIADRAGLGALTLAALAAELEVRPPSLYAHVDGLEGVHRELTLRSARALGAALRGAAQDTSGPDTLRALAHAYRAFARRQPGSYEAALRVAAGGPDADAYGALASMVLPFIEALADAGVTPADQVHLTRTIRGTLHGFVALERAGGFGASDSVEESFGRTIEMLIAEIRAALAGV